MATKRFLLVVTVIAAAVVGVQAQGGKSPAIAGVWRVSEVRLTGANARTISSPQPGLVIFTQRHYSITIVTSDTPRPEIPAQGQATDKQLADAFGPFQGQAGTYEIKGGELITHPVAAKAPNAMRAGSVNTATFVLSGNTLTITTKSNVNGPVANPTTTKYTRVE